MTTFRSPDELPEPRPIHIDPYIPSLPEIVQSLIWASSEGEGKYFDPPPEARYLSNRNIDMRRLVSTEDDPIQPSDIDLDSTECYSNFHPPIKFVSIIAHLHHFLLTTPTVVH
jgi:hypothetical protein